MGIPSHTEQQMAASQKVRFYGTFYSLHFGKTVSSPILENRLELQYVHYAYQGWVKGHILQLASRVISPNQAWLINHTILSCILLQPPWAGLNDSIYTVKQNQALVYIRDSQPFSFWSSLQHAIKTPQPTHATTVFQPHHGRAWVFCPTPQPI